jgi:hypothetical protein
MPILSPWLRAAAEISLRRHNTNFIKRKCDLILEEHVFCIYQKQASQETKQHILVSGNRTPTETLLKLLMFICNLTYRLISIHWPH